MGYRIEYGEKGHVHFRKYSGKRIQKWCVVAICAAVVLAALLIGWQNEQLRTFIFPGDPEVTAAAFQELVSSLRSGEGIREAVTAFCAEVMENVQIAR